MKILIDNDEVILLPDSEGSKAQHFPIGSPEAFHLISKAWLRTGWDNKYVYSFTWLGRPIIQLPEDMFRLQEVIYRLKPDVIIETGVAHGGSSIFFASLCRSIGKGRIISIDIEIRSHNRAALESHELYPYITLVEGDAVSEQTAAHVRSLVHSNETILVMLDSNHTVAHVLRELELYSPLVTPDSYIVVADGIMQELVGAPRSSPTWAYDNPLKAVMQFIAEHSDFTLEEPRFAFNEGNITERVTYWPHAYLRRVNGLPPVME